MGDLESVQYDNNKYTHIGHTWQGSACKEYQLHNKLKS